MDKGWLLAYFWPTSSMPRATMRGLTRDADARLTAVTSSSTGFAYAYDADGDVTSRTYPDGEKSTFTYDKDDQQTGQTADGATTAYAYDADGQLTTTTPPSGAGAAETRSYDAAGRLVTDKSYEGTYSLSLNADGQPTSVELSVPLRQINGRQVYSYDSDGRLLTSCTTNTESALCTGKETYTYDKVGNRLSETTATTAVGGNGPTTTTYSYNAADELTQSSNGTTTTAYTYDADGNQTAAGSNTFTYNAANELSGANVSGTAYTFTNNAEGNRVTTSSGGAVDQTQTWDINGSQPQLATLQGAGGTLEGDYHYDPLGTIQSEHTGAGAFYDYTNYLGSVTDLVSSAGVDQESYTYDAYGGQGSTQLVSTAPAQPFGFAGALEDQTVPGQVELGARSYTPATGTFTQRDPQAPKNTDPYVAAYVYGDDAPTYLTDPTGDSPISWLESQWDQFSSGFVQGTEAPFKLVDSLYDAFTGKNGGWSGFFDTYVPARPAYRLYTIADMLRNEGCDQLADLYENAGNELASQIAVLGIGGLTGWEADAAAADSSEMASTAGAGGGWPTIGETPGGAVGQITPLSCVAACAEMVSDGDLLQSELVSTKEMPWSLSGLAAELQEKQPGEGWQFSSPDPGVPALLQQLGKQSVGVADLKSGMPHAVVVEGLDAAGNIVIRDPWDGGSTYTMATQDFENNFMGHMVWKPKG